jgi:hypothetical protein
MQEKMLFLISTPRSGSTLLMRILNATSSIYSRPEPHLIPALAHLGYWEAVDKAPYDQLQAQQAIRAFAASAPDGEAAYYEACRRYSDHIYAKMFEEAKEGESYFLDKTPANALVLPFLAKLYPQAKFIVLTRHPAAIFASYASSFFDDDYDAAVKFNPILSRYIPVMSAFLRETTVDKFHVSYEDVASNPEQVLERISSFLDIPFEPSAVQYQSKGVAEGLGDPLGVHKHARPVTDSIHKWAPALLQDPKKFEVVARQLASVQEQDLETWGVPKSELWAPMEQLDKKSAAEQLQKRKREWNKYLLTRKTLIWLRKDIHNKPLGALVRKIRFFCDVLLRG